MQNWLGMTAYCSAAAMHREALLAIETDGAVAISSQGAPYQNPWVSILNRQAELLAKLGSRLGLDPAARQALVMPERENKNVSGMARLMSMPSARKAS